MATKPNASDSDYNLLESWGGTKEKPASNKIIAGFSSAEKPSAKNFNWKWNWVFTWIKYLHDAIDELFNLSYIRVQVNQTAHGFNNDLVYCDTDDAWKKAIATSKLTLATHFAVRIDDNNFYAYVAGEISKTGILDASGSGLTNGTYYYLSKTTAGKATSTLPLDVDISQPCFKVDKDILKLVYTPNTASSVSQPGYVPYSVNSGLTSINNIGGSQTSVSFTGTPTITFPNGNTYKDLTLNNVTTGLADDGTYSFIIEEADISNGAVTPKAVLVSKINETTTNGTGGSSGDYNLNIKPIPFYPEKKISSTWTLTQFVKIGEVLKTGGVLGTPKVYAFNGKYRSADIACPAPCTLR